MAAADKLDSHRAALARLAAFLQAHSALINVCMVDFITRDVFASVLPQPIQGELVSQTEEDLKTLPAHFLQGQSQNRTHFILEIQAHTLESLGVVESRVDFHQSIGLTDNQSLFEHFDPIMGDKKMHEVLELSQVIEKMCQVQGISCLADIGSGKGYLCSILAAFHDIKILAVDSQAVNTNGAQKRDKNLERKWNALIRRAKIRSQGEDPPMRSKRWKKHLLQQESRSDGEPSRQESLGSEDLVKDGGPSREEGLAQEDLVEDGERHRLRHVTQFVDTTTHVTELFEAKFGPSTSSDYGIVGLHTCGGLAVHSMRMFLAQSECRILVNVGCCYHHLDEEFYRNPYLSPEDNDQCHRNATFPVSSVLRSIQFQLGRNARMVAAQPMDRMASNCELPTSSLLWRAILQKLIREKHPNLGFQDQHVGRIAKKATNFPHYLRLAWTKLNLGTIPWTDMEIESLYERERKIFGHKLNAFYQYRSLFAPLIEGLILLDRLVFLLEQGDVLDASLVQLFDPVISPRCLALVATKAPTSL